MGAGPARTKALIDLINQNWAGRKACHREGATAR
jgi:hypothetical protein